MKNLLGAHLLLLTAVVPLASSCGGCTSFRDCSTEDISLAEALPTRLSETGLYSDIENDVLADDAIAFEPRFPLWTDGAKKRRWLILPEGAQVDTQDPDDWNFPVGTKLFKEFTRDDVRLETRLNTRTEDGWAAVSYVWNNDGDDAERQLENAENVGGTEHDVPGAAECLTCHAGRRGFTLGFSATQLTPEARSTFFDDGLLSHAVETELDLPPNIMEGLGVLHGNCSHCHNAERFEQPQATGCYAPPSDDDLINFTLPSGLASIEDAPALLTARFQLGDTDDSNVLTRMSERNLNEEDASMPPLGTELVDDDGVAAVEAMIAELPPNEGNGGR